MKQTAQEKLIIILMTCGYSESEAIDLLCRFLEEEAELYMDCIMAVDETKQDRIKLFS